MPENQTITAAIAAMPSLPDGDRYLTTAEVAEMVGLSVLTLRDYRSKNRKRFGPRFHKFGDKTVLYRLTEVLDWIDSRVSSHGVHYNG